MNIAPATLPTIVSPAAPAVAGASGQGGGSGRSFHSTLESSLQPAGTGSSRNTPAAQAAPAGPQQEAAAPGTGKTDKADKAEKKGERAGIVARAATGSKQPEVAPALIEPQPLSQSTAQMPAATDWNADASTAGDKAAGGTAQPGSGSGRSEQIPQASGFAYADSAESLAGPAGTADVGAGASAVVPKAAQAGSSAAEPPAVGAQAAPVSAQAADGSQVGASLAVQMPARSLQQAGSVSEASAPHTQIAGRYASQQAHHGPVTAAPATGAGAQQGTGPHGKESASGDESSGSGQSKTAASPEPLAAAQNSASPHDRSAADQTAGTAAAGPPAAGAALNAASLFTNLVNPGAPAASAPAPSSAAPGSAHLADAQAPIPGTATAASGLPAINSARLLQTMNGTEMRVGMHSAEFGSISVATSISPGEGVAAQIALDHNALSGALGKALAAHLPDMEARLGSSLGVSARVELRDAGTAGSPGQQAPGQNTGHGYRQSRSGGSTQTPPMAGETGPDRILSIAGAPLAGSPGVRLSIRV